MNKDDSGLLTNSVLVRHSVPLRGDDTMMKGDFLEIVAAGVCVSVNQDLWRSWTGKRFVNGEEYHGPVYIMHTDNLYSGSRSCLCHKCQQDASPETKPN